MDITTQEKAAPTIVAVDTVDDVAMVMNDDGVLEYDSAQMDAVEKFITDSKTEETESVASENEEGNKAVSPQPDEKQLLYEHLLGERARDQQQIDILKLQLQQMVAAQQNQPVDPNAPSFSEMISDNEKGPLFIDKLVDLKLKQKLESLNLPGLYETISKVASKVEYDSFKASHPEIIDSVTKDVKQSYKDVMIPLLNGDKSLTYEGAFNKLIGILPKALVTGTPKGGDSTLATPKKLPTPPKDLVARAAALKTESGVSARTIGNKPIETLKDAFLQAWETEINQGN